jgi:O-antigen/teichoic acid export membrane protein
MIGNIFKDMGKYLPAMIVPGMVSFISIPIITRLFPPGEYGNYILVISTISVLGTLVGWLPVSILRFYPAYKRDNKLDKIHDTVIIMTFITILVSCLVFAGVLLLLKSRISEELYSLMSIGIIVFIVTSCFQVLIDFCRADRKISCYSASMVWKSISSIGFGILLVMVFDFDVSGLLWGTIVSCAIAIPFLWNISLGKVPLRVKNFTINLTSEMAKYGIPLVAGNLAAWVLSLSDRYVLAFFLSSTEVGIYSASYSISENSIMLIATLFSATSASMVFNIWEKEGEKKSREFVSLITRYYLLVGIPAVVGLSVLAKPLVSILTEQKYQEGYTIIPLVVSGAFFLGLQQRFFPGFAFYKKTQFVMLSIILSGLLNLGLNFLLIPKFGYRAAAVTTLMSYAFLLILIVVLSRRFFIWEFPYKTLRNVACASSLMGVAVYIVGNNLTSSVSMNLALGIFVGIAVYTVMLFVIGEPNRQEIRIMVDFKLKIIGKILK